MNFKIEQQELMSAAGEDASDSDELKIIRVNDIDLKSAVDGLESSEDEDLENEKEYGKKKGKHKKGQVIMAQHDQDEEPAEEPTKSDHNKHQTLA